MFRGGVLALVLLMGAFSVSAPESLLGACVDDQAQASVNATTFDAAYVVHVDYSINTSRGADAMSVCEGALASYAAHVGWGFASDDNATLNYTFHTHRTSSNPGQELDILVSIHLVDGMTHHGIQFTNNTTLHHSAVHHETNHHFVMSELNCYSGSWWNATRWLWNGYGLFVETIQHPDEAHAPGSLFYEKEGANDYVRNTTTAMDAWGHETALLHGYLYAHNGGLNFTHNLLDEARGQCANQTLADGIGYLNAALAASPGVHDNFSAAFVDFALDLAQRTNLSWGPPNATDKDWETWLEKIDKAEWDMSRINGTLNPWSFEVVHGTPWLSGGDQIHLFSPGPLNAHLVVRDGTDWQRIPFVRSATVPTTFDDAFVVLVAPSLQPIDYVLVRPP